MSTKAEEFPGKEDVRTQLERIKSGEQFVNSPRLQLILDFIVEEFLAGRKKYIKGATIGNALFSQNDELDNASSSAVRVEMGRLRRRLVEYYAEMGENDPIIIAIPKGSYIPDFQRNPKHSQEDGSTGFKKRLRIVQATAVTALFLLLLIGVWLFQNSGDKQESFPTSSAVHQAQSSDPETNALFKQAFMLLMPPEEGLRLSSSIELFKRVVEMDPVFPGGYTGQSIAQSFRVFFLKSLYPERDIVEALELSERAVKLNPNYGLGLAARGLALSLQGNEAEAVNSVRKAITIRPPDANANAIAALALIVVGEINQAQALLTESTRLNPNDSRTPYLNILAATYLIQGEYELAVNTFENNLDAGGPSGAHIDVLLAVAYSQQGKSFKAKAILSRITEARPDFPVHRWIANFIHSEEERMEIVENLKTLGYSW